MGGILSRSARAASNPMIDTDKTPIIKPCPMPGCGRRCYVTEKKKHWFLKDTGQLRSPHWVLFCPTCGYRILSVHSESDVVDLHNQLCKLVAYGQRAMKACEMPPRPVPQPDSEDKQANMMHVALYKGFEYGVHAVLDLLQPPSEVPGRGE